MIWTVEFTRNSQKQLKKLPQQALEALRLLVEDLKTKGPFPGKSWPHYSKLSGPKNEDKRHCHLIRGRPTYVSCWAVVSKKARLIEVYYVGTHEKAPY